MPVSAVRLCPPPPCRRSITPFPAPTHGSRPTPIPPPPGVPSLQDNLSANRAGPLLKWANYAIGWQVGPQLPCSPCRPDPPTSNHVYPNRLSPPVGEGRPVSGQARAPVRPPVRPPASAQHSSFPPAEISFRRDSLSCRSEWDDDARTTAPATGPPPNGRGRVEAWVAAASSPPSPTTLLMGR